MDGLRKGMTMKKSEDSAHRRRLWPGDHGYLQAIPLWTAGKMPTNKDGSVDVPDTPEWRRFMKGKKKR